MDPDTDRGEDHNVSPLSALYRVGAGKPTSNSDDRIARESVLIVWQLRKQPEREPSSNKQQPLEITVSNPSYDPFDIRMITPVDPVLIPH